MAIISLEQWKQWQQQKYTHLPYVECFELGTRERVASWEQAWTAASGDAFILESGKDGRYTYVGMKTERAIAGKGYEAVLRENGQEIKKEGPPLAQVKAWMADYTAPTIAGVPPFIGGCAGYLGYDVVRSIEKLPLVANDDLPIPDYYFVMVNELWIIDHLEHKLYCAFHTHVHASEDKSMDNLYVQAAMHVAEMKANWDKWMLLDSELESLVEARKTAMKASTLHVDVEAIQGIETVFTKERFKAAVQTIQEYIAQGDVFQVNLSVRQRRRLQSAAEDVYEWLRLVNPSPYMGMMKFDDFQLVSASPELLVKSDGLHVSARPIAGTRRRGRNDEEDRALAAELLANEKERAEHIMLVDLERNDLGRISKYGSVHVKDLMVIEYYSHVMHIVSGVEGVLAEGKDAFDVIAATFPGGTITGAPKIRTMEIIEELEPTRRGPYTGSMGWIDYNGNMEFNIIIRTILMVDGVGHIQAGAGIVIDSDPEREYYESLNKAKALWRAIQYSEQMHSVTTGMID